MLIFADAAAIQLALEMPLPDAVRSIIQRIASSDEIRDYTYVAIIHATATEQEIVEEFGWSPLMHPIDEARYAQPGFEPYWAYLTKHDGWFELIQPVGNDGFAYVLLIEDSGDGDLQAMCREYAA